MIDIVCVCAQSELHIPGFGQRGAILLTVLVSQLGPMLPILSLQVKANAVFLEVCSANCVFLGRNANLCFSAQLAFEIGAASKDKRRSTAENSAYARYCDVLEPVNFFLSTVPLVMQGTTGVIR